MSNLFGSGQGKTVATQAVRAQGIQLQASQYGLGLPVVYGRAQIAGALIWYGDFTSVKNTQNVGKGGSGGQDVSYTYSSSFQLALCESDGTCTLGQIWQDSSLVSLSDINGTFGAGGGNQRSWSHLGYPENLNYPFTCWVGCINIKLGSSPTLPNLNFEINGLLQYNAAGGIYDAEPSSIIADMLTSVTHGVGFQYLGDLSLFQSYCVANSIFLSPVFNQESSLSDQLTTLLQICNANAAWSNGLLTIIPYGDEPAIGNGATYIPPTTVVREFTEEDYIKPPKVTRKPLADQYNVIRVEWTDPTNNYVLSTAEAKDEANINASNIRASETIQGDCIHNGQLAQRTAQTLLQRALYIRNTYVFTTTIENIDLEAGDVVSLTDSETMLYKEPVRITSISEQGDNQLEIECEEFPAGVSEGAEQQVENLAGFKPNFQAPPDPTQPIAIFRAPQFLVNGDMEIWLAIAGAGNDWGGANIWVSTDDVNYSNIGSVKPGCRYGETTSPLNIPSQEIGPVNVATTVTGTGSAAYSTWQLCPNVLSLSVPNPISFEYTVKLGQGGTICDLLLSANSSWGRNLIYGFMFRVDGRAGQCLGQTYRDSDFVAGTLMQPVNSVVIGGITLTVRVEITTVDPYMYLNLYINDILYATDVSTGYGPDSNNRGFDGSMYVGNELVTNGNNNSIIGPVVGVTNDPDTIDSFNVVLYGPGALMGATNAEADILATLMLVDQELIAYSSANLNADGSYTLGNGYMRRGCYKTGIYSHLTGAPWLRVDDNFFRWKVDKSLTGQLVYIKVQAWNLYGGGLQDLSTLTPTQYIIGEAEEIPDTPPVPINFALLGVTNGIELVWDSVNPAAVDITSCEYSSNGGASWTVFAQTKGTNATHSFSGNTTYYYRVRARSSQFIWSAYTTPLAATGGSIDYTPDGSTYSRVLAGYVAQGVAYNYKGAYNSGIVYLKGAEVSYNGNYYLCLSQTTAGIAPTNTSYWQLLGPISLDNLTDGTSFARVIAPGLSAGKLIQPGIVQGATSASATYSAYTTGSPVGLEIAAGGSASLFSTGFTGAYTTIIAARIAFYAGNASMDSEADLLVDGTVVDSGYFKIYSSSSSPFQGSLSLNGVVSDPAQGSHTVSVEVYNHNGGGLNFWYSMPFLSLCRLLN
ncbi:MAG: phage tail protein [Acidimicrobiales bacterium]